MRGLRLPDPWPLDVNRAAPIKAGPDKRRGVQDTRQHIVSPNPGLSLHATGEAGRIRYLSLRCRQLEMTPVVWCRNPIVFPGRISLPATRRGRASLPSRVHLRRRYLKEYTLALCPRLRL